MLYDSFLENHTHVQFWTLFFCSKADFCPIFQGHISEYFAIAPFVNSVQSAMDFAASLISKDDSRLQVRHFALLVLILIPVFLLYS